MEIAGTIDNLSYGGARIVGLSMVPPQGILILIRFQLGKEGSETTLTSKVVYATRSVFERQAFHLLGVEFKRPARKTTTYLTRLFLKLRQCDPEIAQSG